MLKSDYLLSNVLQENENQWYTTKKDYKLATLALTILQIVKPIIYFIDLIFVAPTHAFCRKNLFQKAHFNPIKKAENSHQKVLRGIQHIIHGNLNTCFRPLLLCGTSLVIVSVLTFSLLFSYKK
jgi:hypothetical protein